MKLTFTIDPYSYKLTVSGTNDTKIIASIENALSSVSNTRELFYHISDSSSYDSNQFTRQKSEKNALVNTIKDATGYNLRDLAVVGGKFVTEDGTDVFELFKEAFNKNQHIRPYATEVFALYGSQMSTLAKNGFDSVPDLVLSIEYKNGALHDIGQKNAM